MKKKLFGNERYVACECCTKIKKSEDGDVLYCKHKGIVSPGGKCWRFTYDPFKRVPRSAPSIPTFDPEEFTL